MSKVGWYYVDKWDFIWVSGGAEFEEWALWSYDVYRDIADEIGIENALAIYKMFHGTQVSFPNRLFSKDYTHKAIISEYDGDNVPQLAQKYNYSERSIWRILKTEK